MSQEDREQAKSAARRAGVPVGVWLSQQIRTADAGSKQVNGDSGGKVIDASAADRPRGAPARGGPDSRFSFGPGQWSVATDAVETGQVSQPPPQPWPASRPPAGPPPQPMPMPAAMPAPVQQPAPPVATHWGMPPMAHPLYMPQQQVPPPATPQGPPPVDPEALKALERKIESLQKRLAATDARIASELEALGQRLDKVDDLAREVQVLQSSHDDDDEPSYSTAPIERAVMRLSERLQRMEEVLAPEEPGVGFFARLFKRR